MKKFAINRLWISLFIVPFLFTSCEEDFLPGISGYGDVVTRTLDVDDFSGFGNAIAADIYLSQGEEHEVVIEAQENIIDNLDLSQVGGGFWNIRFDRFVRRAKPIKLFITVPNLDAVIISGSGDVFGETAFKNLEDLELKISGSGSMDLDIECQRLDVTVSGSGDFDLAGKAPETNVIISGSGGIRAYDLETESVDFKISGSGSGRLSVSDYLNVIISGSGNLYYRGNPQTDVHISGSGEVVRDR